MPSRRPAGNAPVAMISIRHPAFIFEHRFVHFGGGTT
jgi:hypothetical protein